ncbi:MAG: bacterial transcriptional activator domain-containing protein [Pseudomonadota bacterium]
MHWTFLDGTSLTGPKTTVEIPPGRVAALAAVLVLHAGRPVERERISDILWEGESPDNARDRLNTLLWRLRRLIRSSGGKGRCIENRRAYLKYTPPQEFSVDALRISAAARQLVSRNAANADTDELFACADAYHTDFLSGSEDHWSIVTREALRSGILTILEALLERMSAAGSWGRVSELAERMMALDPTLEAGHRHMIALHGRRDDVSAAERQYQVLSRVLKDKLDVDPAPETAAAIDALRINRGPQPGKLTTDGKRRTLVQRPSFKAVESALEHLDTARAHLLG